MKRSAYRLSGFKSRLMIVVGAPILFVAIAAAILVPIFPPPSPTASPLKQALVTEILLLGTGIAVLCVVGCFIIKPLRQLAKAAQEIVRGETGSAIPLQRKDEIGAPADSLNQPTQYRRTLEQASQSCSRGHFDARTLAMRSAEAALHASALIEESTQNAETGVAINREVMQNLEEINAHFNRGIIPADAGSKTAGRSHSLGFLTFSRDSSRPLHLRG